MSYHRFFLQIGLASCFGLGVESADDSINLLQVSAQVTKSRSDKLELSDTAWMSIRANPYLMLDTHKSEGKKLLFCMIPKNACTEFLSLMMRIDGFADDHWNPTSTGEKQEFVHYDETRKTIFSELTAMERKEEFESRMDGSDGSGYQRAVFLRDPLHRLLSAFQSKVQTGFYEGAGDSGYVDLSIPKDTTFEAFLSLLEQYGVDDHTVDPHIRAQAGICGLNETLPFHTFVGDFDRLDADSRKMVAKIGGPQFAEEMLGNGWGPNKSQSLFGVTRTAREVGSAGMMPVTSSDIASVTGMDFVQHSMGVLASSAYEDNNRLETNVVEMLADEILAGNPELEARVRKLYAADYALRSKYL